MGGQRKQVQFPDDGSEKLSQIVCEISNREDLTDEDHEALWFSKADYHLSRTAAKVTSRESVRYGFSKNLDDTFSEKNPEAQEKLQLWCVHGDTRRGLERWANREHGEARQQDQFKAVMGVLEAQDELLSASKDGTIDPEKLRKVSHKATKSARHFARMMGKADSYAMANEISKDGGGGSISASECNMKYNGDAETVSSLQSGTVVTNDDASSVCTSDHVSLSSIDAAADIMDPLKDSHHLGERSNSSRRFKNPFRSKRRSKTPSTDEGMVSRVA